MLWVKYRNHHPIMKELWRLHLEGALAPEQEALFAESRPPEELYDTVADPHEVKNLAKDPAYRDDLLRLRAEMERWRGDVGDLGEIPEAEMVRRWYPQGHPPETDAPLVIPVGPHHSGEAPVQVEADLKGPVLMQVYSSTQGASLAYAITDSWNPQWRLYTGPVRLPPGASTFQARACRYGYRESKTVRVELNVSE